MNLHNMLGIKHRPCHVAFVRYHHKSQKTNLPIAHLVIAQCTFHTSEGIFVLICGSMGMGRLARSIWSPSSLFCLHGPSLMIVGAMRLNEGADFMWSIISFMLADGGSARSLASLLYRSLHVFLRAPGAPSMHQRPSLVPFALLKRGALSSVSQTLRVIAAASKDRFRCRFPRGHCLS